jgi:hypothetical protein
MYDFMQYFQNKRDYFGINVSNDCKVLITLALDRVFTTLNYGCSKITGSGYGVNGFS